MMKRHYFLTNPSIQVKTTKNFRISGKKYFQLKVLSVKINHTIMFVAKHFLPKVLAQKLYVKIKMKAFAKEGNTLL